MKSIRREVLTIFYNGGTKEVLSTDGFPYALVKSNRGFGNVGRLLLFFACKIRFMIPGLQKIPCKEKNVAFREKIGYDIF